MAVIEYKLEITPKGELTVTQDVLLIERGDRIRFNDVFGNGTIAIQFAADTPFDDPKLGAGVPFPVPEIAANVDPSQMVFMVTLPNTQLALRDITKYVRFDQPKKPQFSNRRAFHFDCGQIIGGKLQQTWGPSGGDTPDGGKG